MYTRDNTTGQYRAVVTAKNDTANTEFGGKLEFKGASPGLTHVVFGSGVALTLGSAAGLYEWPWGCPWQG